FAPVTEPGSREEHLIRLEHGAPIQFGAGGGQGLRFSRYGSAHVGDVGQADDPSYAFALSRLDSADFAHTPIGLFRQVVRPSYDELMSAQLEEAREKQGDGDLAALLAGNDTWQVG